MLRRDGPAQTFDVTRAAIATVGAKLFEESVVGGQINRRLGHRLGSANAVDRDIRMHPVAQRKRLRARLLAL